MVAIQTVVAEDLLAEARESIKRWREDIGDAGHDFQTLHMFATYLLQVVDSILPRLSGSERIELLESALRIVRLSDPGFYPDWIADPDENEFDGEKDRRTLSCAAQGRIVRFAE